MTAQKFDYRPAQEVQIKTTASTAFNVGDLCYTSSSLLLPASSQADQGTDGQNQRIFAANFVGMCNGMLRSTDAARELPVIVNQDIYMPCAATTFEVGDLVGIYVSSGVFSSQQVAKVTDVDLAIGRCVRRVTSGTGVWFRPFTPWTRPANSTTAAPTAERIQNLRVRVPIATINAGASNLVAARPGYKLRLVECLAIAVGGAAGAVTTVDILATQATSSVKLVAFAQASLTQSAVLKAGGSGAAVLADGASYVDNDVNTAIQISKTGSAITTATNIDIILSYVADPV